MKHLVHEVESHCIQRRNPHAPTKSFMGNVVNIAFIALIFPLQASAHQSKFGTFLNKVNDTLNGASSVLSGKAPPPAVRYEATGVATQKSSADRSERVEVNFPQGRTEQFIALFNEALPVVDKTLGVIRCMPYNSLPSSNAMAINSRAWDSLHPYEVDHGTVRRPGYLYGTPMGQLKYHDERLCLELSRIVVDAPANNALRLETTFLATDSGETTRYSYLYRKDYRNVWQLAGYDRISD